MKIQGRYLAWALIHFSFFLTFVFVESDIINFKEPFMEVIGKTIIYLGFWGFFGWRFIVNMGEAFQ